MSNVRDFGSAIVALKNGYAVKREGWNEKIYLNKGSFYFDPNKPGGYPASEFNIGGVSTQHFENGHEGTVTRMPNINMHCKNSNMVGWVPSQVDILAEDWTVVTDPA